MNYFALVGATAAALVAFFSIVSIILLAFRLKVRANTAIGWIVGYIAAGAVTAPLAVVLFTLGVSS